MVKLCNRIIEYSFYGLFFLIPLAFTSITSELFEMNKMWLTWGLTIIIGTAWFVKMILQKRILFQRTPLDIPIALFLISQIISTIFSLDFHVSMWGYYSRFNGGLLSILTYIFLYYSFLSNFKLTIDSNPHKQHESFREIRKNIRDFSEMNATKMVKRLLFISLISGTIVALWGLPSHFGYDPTCLLFRGTFDVSCWTADFMPKIRIFSTLGQPDWLAAYLAILIPITIAYLLNVNKTVLSVGSQKNHESGIMNFVLSRKFIHNSLFIILASLFYIDLLYTRARSGILGIWIALLFLGITHIFIETRNKKHETRNTKQFIARYLLPAACLLLLVTFVIGTPFTQLQKFSLAGIGSYFQKAQTSKNPPASASIPTQPVNSGGTESADIRLLVWEGAINAWKENPIFGSGVETFAYVYYKYKPVGQNLTSEWNFLYNKAHNEYLNYLATTGIFGLGTYLGMIIVFLWIALTKITNTFANFAKKFESVREKYEPTSPQNSILILALIAGYLSILVTNFFGFSVVIVNIYLFMIPAFVLVLSGMITKNESGIPTSLKFQGASKNQESRENKTSIYQWTAISFIILASLFMILNLFRFWQADIAYALGYNLDRAGEYQRAYPFLHKAVSIRGDEPVFKDELSINDAIIAASLFSQEKNDKETMSVASQLIQEAVNTSNEIVSQNQNNPVFWKTRVRLFYTLSQVDSRYLPRALDSIAKASLLAPNDANISYNLGVLYGQNNDIKKGVEVLEKTVEMKPDYKDAHYALGLFYRTLATDEKGKVVIDPDMQKKAVEQMQYILDYLSPNDPAALDSIKSWGE